MNSATTTVLPTPAMSADASSPQRPRRNREELEALASQFVNSTLHRKGPLPPPPAVGVPKPMLVAAAGGVAMLALAAWALWPSSPVAADRTAVAAAASEAEALKQRFEAERERKRKQLESGSAYLERMAAADSALLQDMTVHAQQLAKRAEEPGPKAGTPPKTAPVQVARATTTPMAAADRRETADSPVAEPTAAPRAAEVAAVEANPVQVASATCNIHVSELSSSGTLTYAKVAKMNGARLDSRTGHVFTPPVSGPGGRPLVFEVMPDGCARIVRNAG